jgi:hypothetical protein
MSPEKNCYLLELGTVGGAARQAARVVVAAARGGDRLDILLAGEWVARSTVPQGAGRGRAA